MGKEEVFCRVSGKVQGVLYRDFIQKHARHLALTGYVKNLQNGSVEILAQGFPREIDTFLEYARRGPFLARVSNIDVERREVGEPRRAFEVVF